MTACKAFIKGLSTSDDKWESIFLNSMTARSVPQAMTAIGCPCKQNTVEDTGFAQCLFASAALISRLCKQLDMMPAVAGHHLSMHVGCLLDGLFVRKEFHPLDFVRAFFALASQCAQPVETWGRNQKDVGPPCDMLCDPWAIRDIAHTQQRVGAPLQG